MEKTQEMFIIDTNCLLSSCELILNICRTNKLKIILPKIIIDELDKIKDDKQHKENRNAHKALRTISDPTIRIHKEQLLKKKTMIKLYRVRNFTEHILLVKIKLLNLCMTKHLP